MEDLDPRNRVIQHTHIIHIYTYIFTYIYVYIHICIRIYSHIYTCVICHIPVGPARVLKNSRDASLVGHCEIWTHETRLLFYTHIIHKHICIYTHTHTCATSHIPAGPASVSTNSRNASLAGHWKILTHEPGSSVGFSSPSICTACFADS